MMAAPGQLAPASAKRSPNAHRSQWFRIDSIQNHEIDRVHEFRAGGERNTGFHFSSSRSRSDSARITLNFKELEHVLIEKVEQLFRDML
jgi:hypothetical protein